MSGGYGPPMTNQRNQTMTHDEDRDAAVMVDPGRPGQPNRPFSIAPKVSKRILATLAVVVLLVYAVYASATIGNQQTRITELRQQNSYLQQQADRAKLRDAAGLSNFAGNPVCDAATKCP
jgi:hypothetical protein